MYVCICNNLNDRRIREAVADGARTTQEVYQALGCQPQCGQCVLEVQSIVRQARAGQQTSAITTQMATTSLPGAV